MNATQVNRSRINREANADYNVRRVTQGGVHVSYVTGSGIDGCKLNAFVPYHLEPNGSEPPGATVRWVARRCEHDGRIFATRQDAIDFALAYGYTQTYYRRGQMVGPIPAPNN